MTYLLIAIILAIILSPLLSVRSSSRLKQQELFRRLARAEGVTVQLSRRVDARDDEKRLDAVCYRLDWDKESVDDESRTYKEWTLAHGGLRGMEADWPDWRWFAGFAPDVAKSLLDMVIPELPDGVEGIKADQAGVAIFWNEKGTESDLRSIVTVLNILRDQLVVLNLK